MHTSTVARSLPRTTQSVAPQSSVERAPAPVAAPQVHTPSEPVAEAPRPKPSRATREGAQRRFHHDVAAQQRAYNLNHASTYQPGPSLEQVRGGAVLNRGHSGDAVKTLQAQLNAAGAKLDEDGKFGPKTQAALREFQQANGLSINGVATADTLAAIQSKGVTTAAPAQQPNAVDQVQANTNAQAVAPTAGADKAADAKLAALQQNAVRFADGELAKGVRSHNGRGAEVDQYARNAGMPNQEGQPGAHWCGFFVGAAYTNAAHGAGAAGFSGSPGSGTKGVENKEQGIPRTVGSLASDMKAMHYFANSDYTRPNASVSQKLTQQQEAQGSTRQLYTLAGTDGDRMAKGLRHTAVASPRDLPLRPGDTIVFKGHVAMVREYDAATGKLTTVEGNLGGRTGSRQFNVNDAAFQKTLIGFGRPALSDFGVSPAT